MHLRDVFSRVPIGWVACAVWARGCASERCVGGRVGARVHMHACEVCFTRHASTKARLEGKLTVHSAQLFPAQPFERNHARS